SSVDGRSRVEGRAIEVLILVDEHRAGVDDSVEPVAGRVVADVGVGQSELLVCEEPGVHGHTADGYAAMASNARGHVVRDRGDCVCAVHLWAEAGVLVKAERGLAG